MRHTLVISKTGIAMGALAVFLTGSSASAQVFDFTSRDWLSGRAVKERSGGNSDPGLGLKQLRRVYNYPPTADMPAEMVVDNSGIPTVPGLPGEPAFNVYGAWNYPAFTDRGGGAWPYTAPDTQAEKLGDYVWAEPHTNSALQNIGIDTLGRLPNLGVDSDSASAYKSVNDALNEALNPLMRYARWTFGMSYPVGTYQGKISIRPTVADTAPLAPNQRYAIYIRFPGSGTLVGGNPRPNTDHVMVRVSWGANINDPQTSRVFMLNFGETGGYWKRIRTGPGDDRYFPYDGTNPLRVTLYDQTPDLEQVAGQPRSIIVADAVRLVPEALRGDIVAGAASAKFPANVLPDARSVQRTYFGRNEPTGPIYVKTLADAGKYPPSGFTAIGFDPTLPIQANPGRPDYNPAIGDPSSSLKTAVFYCLEDDFANNRYGRLAWRYVARRTPVSTTTADDADPAPRFQASNVGMPGGWTQRNTPDQQFGATYLTVPVTSIGETAVWSASLPFTYNTSGTGSGETYSVFVWIPAGDPAVKPARHATYTVSTDQGPVVVELDQRNTEDTAPSRLGMWRRLASGIRFPVSSFNGNPNAPVAQVTLQSHSPKDVSEDNARQVMADAVQFVAESQSSNSVVAAPTIANVTWPTGTVRQVVYFATTDGHVWALDALGAGGNSTLTSTYWVYPSISNPDTAGDLNGNGAFDGPEDDPNFNKDTQNKDPQKGIDGDLLKSTVGGQTRWVGINKAPDLGPFTASPLFVKRADGMATQEFVVIGNMNGRIYAFDARGRVNPATNEPYVATIAAGDNAGVPGTTRRFMTWPSVARDKFLRANSGSFKQYTDDAAKGYFAADLAAPPKAIADPSIVDHVIGGAGDGHVYRVDIELAKLDVKLRISNSNPGSATDGAPRWMYPVATKQLPAITHAGALVYGTFDGLPNPYWRYVFSAGGRVYAIKDRTDNGAGKIAWVYPHTGSPPGNPNRVTDKPAEETSFTAPSVRAGLGLNGGKAVTFVANRDGRVFAIDASGATNVAPTVLWTSRSQGPTRASATFLASLQRQGGFNTPSGPAIFLPSDTGGIIGFSALTGRLFWNYYDTALGGVPVPDVNGTMLPVPTSFAWRGADAITANTFVYQGDQGNQDTGEAFGQFHAYGSQDIGMITPGEPDVQAGVNTSAELRLVDLWDAKRDDPTSTDPKLLWEAFNDPDPTKRKSPYNERIAGRQKQNTNSAGNFVVYEWGDTVYAAAWGAYTGTQLPQVTFTISSGSSTRTNQALVRPDAEYNGPPLFIQDEMGTDQPANPFLAVTSWPLSRGNEADPQSPGRAYTVAAQAQAIDVGSFAAPTNRLFAGQFDPPAMGAPPAVLPSDPSDLAPPRVIAIAHPMSLTTRGSGPTTTTGPRIVNAIGWTTNYPVNGLAGDPSELVANGNGRVSISGGTSVPLGVRDLVAPLGLIPHGTSAAYMGIDAQGRPEHSLFVADRSNLYKIGQVLSNVRIGRTELAWGWNPNDRTQAATGNVMNPLPWETFPNTVPNVSVDYPDVDRTKVVVRKDGVDLALRNVDLLPPTVLNGIKTINATPLDLVVSVPKYQPANVNRTYMGIDGSVNPSMSQGCLAPIRNVTGSGPYGSAFQNLMSPSAGYYGTMVLFIDSNNDGRYQGTQAQRFGQLPSAIAGAREEVFRQFAPAVGVPPDVAMRTEEATIDIGNVPHGMGYSPTDLFRPRFAPYNNTMSPSMSIWDDPTGRQFFLPFTVKNTGNVNLQNVRIARVMGDYQTNVADPSFWVRLVSDQVDPITGPAIWSVPFNFLGGAATGNLGVVSSLDHQNTPGTSIENSFWPRPEGYRVPAVQDYVTSPNVNGWQAGTRLNPTIHKPRPDTSPQTMSLPDVAYGDPLNLLTTIQAQGRDTSPKISVAVPLTTPAGTYTAAIRPFEDYTPPQWREWLNFYGRTSVTGGDDDGKLNIPLPGSGPIFAESAADPGFTIKLTARESRLTNGQTEGSYPQIDARGVNAPAFGANVGPFAVRDPATHKVIIYFASNRPTNYGSVYSLTNPNDAPWFLNYTSLNSVDGAVAPYGAIWDWRYETGQTRWWDPLPVNNQYPSPAITQQVFPSQASDVTAGNAPLIPGAPIGETVRHASPSVAIAEPMSGSGAPLYLFWQGVVYKGASTGAGNRLDTRTFYTELQSGLPSAAPPMSFLNDPALPKFAPRPMIITDQTGARIYLLFWYGGAQGRTRLYYNANVPGGGAAPTSDGWSADTALSTPAALQWQADPNPIHRVVIDPNTNQTVDAIDIVYTGVLSSRKLAETMLTRYQVVRNGNRVSLRPMQLTLVDSETMARDGNTNTWTSRDLAWMTRGPVDRNLLYTHTYPDNSTRPLPWYQVYVTDRSGASRFTFSDGKAVPINGYTQDATGNWFWNEPTYDQTTQRWTFRSALGGNLIVDAQGGAVSFTGVAPRTSDRVSLSYVPQSLRINVTRSESGAVTAPTGWASDPGFQPRPHVPAAGSNSGPNAFLDLAANSRQENVIPRQGGSVTPMPVTRLWTFFRKTNSNVTATSTIYYKTMRLMVRLPRGILRDRGNMGNLDFRPNLAITGNRGPVEVDWVRGRLYFTEIDEGSLIAVTRHNFGRDTNGNVQSVPRTEYRVSWGDEISTAATPGDQPTNEVALPTDSAVNEGQISAFKDPFQDKVWIFWTSTRFGTSDLYYMTINPPFYALPAQ